MKAVFNLFAVLLRLLGILFAGEGARTTRGDHEDNLGYPDAMKLRSSHVDPYRIGNYYPWTKRDE